MAEILGPKYVGRKAQKYTADRASFRKWENEHRLIHEMLAGEKPGTKVLDMPVGTGRLLKFFDKKKFVVTGVDSSEDMLAQAKALKTKATLGIGDASSTGFKDRAFDVVCCIRLLHLVDEANLKKIFREIDRLAKRTIILTIKINKSYRVGHEVAVHDERKFRAMVAAAKFEVTQEHRITGAGWRVMRLDRK